MWIERRGREMRTGRWIGDGGAMMEMRGWSARAAVDGAVGEGDRMR
jgi:hypothetical protein